MSQLNTLFLLLVVGRLMALPAPQYQGYGGFGGSNVYQVTNNQPYSNYQSYQSIPQYSSYSQYNQYTPQVGQSSSYQVNSMYPQSSVQYNGLSYSQQPNYYQNSYYTPGQTAQSYQDSIYKTYPVYNDLSYSGSFPVSSSQSISSSPTFSYSSSSSSGPSPVQVLTSTRQVEAASPVQVLTSAKQVKTQTPAWQGRVDGVPSTKCHDGALFPFRARCNKKIECSEGEDEYDCDWHKNSTVRTVTGVSQLEQVLRDNQNVLVEFFAPWCPACVTFLPELEKIKSSTWDIPLTVIKINTDNDPELKGLYNVDTYPRVLMWSKSWGEGDQYMYKDFRKYEKKWGMKADKVHSWVRQQL